jgi:hypothetical protein
MSITAKKPEGDFRRVEPGNYVARCYKMIEIGTVEETFNGETKRAKKVQLTWELPTEMEVFHEEKGYEPYVVSKTYTLSLHEKSKLRADLESWRGKGFSEAEAQGFDITKLLGVPCMLNIIHRPGKVDPSKTYVEISNVSRMPKGMECPAPLNESVRLEFDDWKPEVFEGLSDYLKEKIQSSDEYKKMNSGSNTPVEGYDPKLAGDLTSDLPF